MERDPAELRAEFEAECQRTGVRVQDIMPPIDTESDLAIALDCLRGLPKNAGINAFVLYMNMYPSMYRAGYRPSAPSHDEFWTLPDTRVEYDEPSHVPSMSEIEDAEEYLLAFVTSLTGDAATRDRALQRRCVYKEYAKILNAYLDHVGDGVEGVEALRRVTFLLWCAATQPACLTGIDELSESQEREIISELERACASDTLDPQLRWMLAYYHSAYPEVFGRFTQARALQRMLARTFPSSWRSAEPEARYFARRGLMGRFWSQLVLAD